MAIGIEYKGLAPSGIPIPPAAPHDPDPNPSTYIPTGMSKQDRENLKAAAIEWTNTLGASSVMNATISTLTSKGRAADNMSHYRHGGGSTKVFSEDDVSDIRHEVPAVASFETNNLELFLNMVHEDFKTRGDKTGGYLSLNTKKNLNWFGQYAKYGSEWFYAMGGFQISYGAQALLSLTHITILYRLYVADRYNWDVGKVTAVPKDQLQWLLGDKTMNKILGLKDSIGADYFNNTDPKDINGNKNTDEYVVNDSLMGSLETTGNAAPFDLWGTGKIRVATYPLATPVPVPSPVSPSAPSNNSGDSR